MTFITVMMMTFITRGGEGREDKNEDRKATRSEGRGPEESASRALMRRVGMTIIPEEAKAENIWIQVEMLREAKAEARKRVLLWVGVLVARSCAMAKQKQGLR